MGKKIHSAHLGLSSSSLNELQTERKEAMGPTATGPPHIRKHSWCL
jgi:hypothetical protein